MTRTIDAKPTKYGGRLMRSRLEAKWASFFDIVGWQWTYEPRRVDGWLPDFELHPQASERSILVEVKPIIWGWGAGCDLKEELARVEPALRRGDDRVVLLLGAGLAQDPDGYPAIGLVLEDGHNHIATMIGDTGGYRWDVVVGSNHQHLGLPAANRRCFVLSDDAYDDLTDIWNMARGRVS